MGETRNRVAKFTDMAADDICVKLLERSGKKCERAHSYARLGMSQCKNECRILFHGVSEGL